MIRRAEKNSSKKRFPFLLFLAIPILIVIGIYYGIGSYYLPKERTTILFLTDPVEIASFEPSKKQWSRLQFPADTHIAGIQGLGGYAVVSLWNIASTEGSPSAVVLGSMTDELGVPVEYYVGERGDIWGNQPENTNILARFMSLSGMFRRLVHAYETNIPVPLFISLTRSLRATENHRIEVAVLENGSGLVEKKLPDGSTILEFERYQFDSRTTDIFEDSQIRDEGLRIAVFNTTGTPFLGTRVARIIDRLGSNVIQVGNEDEAIEACELSGLSEQLATKTARTIEQLFLCTPKETSEQGRADLTVKIGNVYKQRFLPSTQ